MPYVDLAGLSRFDGKLKDFASSECAGLDMANWQKTPAAGAVSFSPVPEMPLDPAVNFLFTETGPASGTKSPDNPSTITGVAQAKVTRCGKNLFKRPYQNASGSTIYTTTFSVDNETGTVTANTPTSSPNNAVFWLEGGTSSVRLVGGNTYFLSGCPAGGSANTYRLGLTFYSLNHEPIGPSFYEYGDGCVVTPSVDCYFVATATVRAGATVSNLVFKPQLELGSAATSFEPYSGADYTVNLGGTYYGGSVDLSTGVMTVTHVECVADGTNIYAQSSVGDIGVSYRHAINVVSFGLPAPIIGDYESSSSTHFTCISGLFSSFGVFSQASQYIIVCDKDGLYPTNQSFNDWLKAQNTSGTPVKFVYTVANSFTISLTPMQIYSLSQPDPYTPRTNTVYSDQVSVQAGYPKSPQAAQNELTSAIVSLGGNL